MAKRRRNKKKLLNQNKQPKIDSGIERSIKTEDGTVFVVHQGTLSSCSEYFKRLFSYESEEVILIQGISGPTLQSIISFIEKDEFAVNSSNFVEILRAADFLVVIGLIKKIRSSLPDLISNENIHELHLLASELEHLNLLKLTELYLTLNFQTVLNLTKIGEMPLNHFVNLLSDDYLNLDTEDIVWEAIVKWVTYDKKNRLQFVPKLLCCIRFEICDMSLVQKIVDHPMLQRNSFCSDIVDRTKFKRSKPDAQRLQFVEGVKKLSSGPVCFGSRLPQRMLCHIDCEPLHAMVDGDPINYCTQISMRSIVDERTSIVMDKNIHFFPTFAFSSGRQIFLLQNDNFRCHVRVFDLTDKSQLSFLDPRSVYRAESCSYSLVKGRLVSCMVLRESPTLVAAVYDPEFKEWRTKSAHHFTPRFEWSTINFISFLSTSIEESIYCFVRVEFGEGCSWLQQIQPLTAVYNTEEDSWVTIEIPDMDKDWNWPWYLTSYQGAVYTTTYFSTAVKCFVPSEGIFKTYQELPITFKNACPAVYSGTLIFYDTKDPRHSLYWNEESQQWKPFQKTFELECEVTDEEVVKKFHPEFLKVEWKAAVKDCRLQGK